MVCMGLFYPEAPSVLRTSGKETASHPPNSKRMEFRGDLTNSFVPLFCLQNGGTLRAKQGAGGLNTLNNKNLNAALNLLTYAFHSDIISTDRSVGFL